jgi:SAM-dependent methyltransferase
VYSKSPGSAFNQEARRGIAGKDAGRKPVDRPDYTEVNAQTIDRWVEAGWEWGRPLSPEDFANIKTGSWGIYLSPQRVLPREWLLPLEGKEVLGLAAGGAQQMPVLAALGARCTVLDYSERQLASERLVAQREGYAITVIRGDMTKALPFPAGSFDLIVHPVSNCYVEDVRHVWRECFRVLRPGGSLLAGMDNGLNFLFEDLEKGPLLVVNKLPVNPLRDPARYAQALQENDGIQFSHSLEEQLGGQLEAGFVLTGLYEDRDRGALLAEYAPQYLVTRAVKPA